NWQGKDAYQHSSVVLAIQEGLKGYLEEIKDSHLESELESEEARFTNFRLAVENAHANSVEAAHDELKSKLRRGALMGAGASAVISAVFTGIHAMNAPHAEHDSVSQPEANAA